MFAMRQRNPARDRGGAQHPFLPSLPAGPTDASEDEGESEVEFEV
jgi:hypothetical protein